MSELYEVVWPSGKLAIKRAELAPRVTDMNTVTVAEINHNSYRGDEIFPILREELKRRYPNIRIVPFEEIGNFRDQRNFEGYEMENYPRLSELLKQKGIDAAITGIGA
jgi:hypothetical protein